MYLTMQTCELMRAPQLTVPKVPEPLLTKRTVPDGGPAGLVTIAVQRVEPLIWKDLGMHEMDRLVGASCVTMLVAVVADVTVLVVGEITVDVVVAVTVVGVVTVEVEVTVEV